MENGDSNERARPRVKQVHAKWNVYDIDIRIRAQYIYASLLLSLACSRECLSQFTEMDCVFSNCFRLCIVLDLCVSQSIFIPIRSFFSVSSIVIFTVFVLFPSWNELHRASQGKWLKRNTGKACKYRLSFYDLCSCNA